MPFQIVRNDITKMKVDAVINTANPNAVYGRGTDQAIYEAAGRDKLLAARQKIGTLQVGEAVVTPGFRLPAKYIIHNAGPVWEGGDRGEEEKLELCYENCLRLADTFAECSKPGKTRIIAVVESGRVRKSVFCDQTPPCCFAPECDCLL